MNLMNVVISAGSPFSISDREPVMVHIAAATSTCSCKFCYMELVINSQQRVFVLPFLSTWQVAGIDRSKL